MTPQTADSSNFFPLILIVYLLIILFDFITLGGFNYPLLVKLIYMIMLIFGVIVLLHPEEMKRTLK